MSHAEIFNAVMTALDMYNEGWKPDWEDGTYNTASLDVVTI